jgi:hypothetical protein
MPLKLHCITEHCDNDDDDDDDDDDDYLENKYMLLVQDIGSQCVNSRVLLEIGFLLSETEK